jgi:hypothetical protein
MFRLVFSAIIATAIVTALSWLGTGPALAW